MYYVELIDRFWLFNEKAKPGTAAISLYLYLLQISKKKDTYRFTISDVELGRRLGLGRATIKTTREKLIDLGLISYQNVQGAAGNFRLILDYALEQLNCEDTQMDAAHDVINFFGRNDDPILIEQKDHLETPVSTSEQNVSSRSSELSVKDRIVPDLHEFLNFARALEAYRPELDVLITAKYSGWLDNGWKSSSGRQITNWRSSLKNVVPFLKTKDQDSILSIGDIPDILHPKNEREV